MDEKGEGTKEGREKEKEIEKRGEKCGEGWAGEGGETRRASSLASTPRMAEGQTGKKKEDATWQGGEVKLDTKSSKKN